MNMGSNPSGDSELFTLLLLLLLLFYFYYYYYTAATTTITNNVYNSLSPPVFEPLFIRTSVR